MHLSRNSEGQGKKRGSDFVWLLTIDLHSYLRFQQFAFLSANIDLGDLVAIYSTTRAIIIFVFGYKVLLCTVISNLC